MRTIVNDNDKVIVWEMGNVNVEEIERLFDNVLLWELDLVSVGGGIRVNE